MEWFVLSYEKAIIETIVYSLIYDGGSLYVL